MFLLCLSYLLLIALFSVSRSRFYTEIGTPLLSDIRVEYSNDAVEYVTQNLFPNYFNGSEIVVAGKLTNRSSDSLHVQVTASNSDRSLVMEKDISLSEREHETKRRVEEAEAGPNADGYVERLWGFLSVKDGLNERVRSHTSSERENFTQRVTELALSYNFLTPLTQMEVETPQVVANGILAEVEPTETAPACTDLASCSDEGEPTIDTPQSLHRNKEQPATGSTARKATSEPCSFLMEKICVCLVLRESIS